MVKALRCALNVSEGLVLYCQPSVTWKIHHGKVITLVNESVEVLYPIVKIFFLISSIFPVEVL